jgi:hypothetical protein
MEVREMKASSFIGRFTALLVPSIVATASLAWGGTADVPYETAAGPFEVAGSPDSYSVAWVEQTGEFETLWLRVESGTGSSRLHLVAGLVEGEAGIRLDASATRVATAWKSGGAWKLGSLDLGDDDAEVRTHALGPGRLLGVSLRDGDASVVALLQDDPGDFVRLVEIDPVDWTSETLYETNEDVDASALLALGDRIAAAWTDAGGGLTLRVLDGSGPVTLDRKLNVFPVAHLAPRIGRFEQTLTVAWIERLPGGALASRVAVIAADGTLRILDAGEIPGADLAASIVPSQGDGRLLVRAWDDRSDLMLLDGRTDLACGTPIADSRPSAGTWLLGDGDGALLFRSVEAEDGRFSLTSQPVHCGSEISTGDSLVPGISPRAGGSGSSGDGGTTTGGSEDPCNGWDDDGDGILDNGCDRICDDPEVGLGPFDFMDDTWQSASPAVVRAGSEFGVVYQDSRGTHAGIFFARMDETGAMVYERRITPDTHVARRPTLTWTGSQYAVVWEDFSTGRFEIFVSVLNSDGSNSTSPLQVTDLCTGPGCTGVGGQEPSIAWSGSGFGVLFSSSRNGNDELFYARLQPSGVKLGTDDVVRAGGDSRRPSVAWDGTQFGVAWTETLAGGEQEIYFTTVTVTGIPGTLQRITNATGLSDYPSLIWVGTVYGLAWQDARIGGNEIYFVRLDATGSKIGSDERLTFSTGSAFSPSLAWTGQEYAVSWNDTRGGNQDVYTARVSSAGVKQGFELRVSTPPAEAGFTSLAWSGTGQVVVWEDRDDGVWGVHAAFVRCCDDLDGDGYSECAGDPNDQDPSGYPGGPDACDGRDNNGDGVVDETCDGICTGADDWDGDLRVSDSNAGVYTAEIAWNGSEFGVAWGQNLGGANLWFRRLDAAGQPLGPATTVVASGSVHSMVWNGTEYGLLADDGTGAMLVRLDATGNLVGTSSFDPMDDPVMVWNGSEYAVVTDEFLFYRIDAVGNQLGTPVDLGISSVFPYPDLAWTGSEYGLVYARNGIYFQRFDVNGTLVGSEMTVTTDGTTPSIVWTGSEYGVAWNYANGINDNGIRFVRLDAAGVIQGTPATVTSAVGNSQAPVVRWTGEEYGVVWQDDQFGLDYIFFRRLTAAGAPSGSILRAMQPIDTDARWPAMVWSGTDYGIVSRYIHISSTSYETWFQLVRCCGQSADGDGYGKCEDCDDQNPDVYPFAPQICDGLNNDCRDPAWPLLDGTNEADIDGDNQSECAGDCDETDITVYLGAPELCDFQDNDCDTVIDEGFPIPGASSFTAFYGDKQKFDWGVAELADRYDVVRGVLETLHSTGGDFSASVESCLEDDTVFNSTKDPAVPDPGGGLYYLIRAQAACKDGTYDSGGAGQSRTRDAGIESSSNTCP